MNFPPFARFKSLAPQSFNPGFYSRIKKKKYGASFSLDRGLDVHKAASSYQMLEFIFWKRTRQWVMTVADKLCQTRTDLCWLVEPTHWLSLYPVRKPQKNQDMWSFSTQLRRRFSSEFWSLTHRYLHKYFELKQEMVGDNIEAMSKHRIFI